MLKGGIAEGFMTLKVIKFLLVHDLAQFQQQSIS